MLNQVINTPLGREELLDRHVFNLGGDVAISANLGRAYEYVGLEELTTEMGLVYLLTGYDWVHHPHLLGLYRAFHLEGLMLQGGVLRGPRAVQVVYEQQLTLEGL